MNFIALRMLMGDRVKYLSIIIGITIASFLMTQQLSIFVGLMSRTFGFIHDTAQAELWVMDPKVQFIDDVKPLQDTVLQRVRGVSGVEWAMPLYKGILRARLDDGNFQNCNVIGLDDATLMGGPPVMVDGTLEGLRQAEGVIVDKVGASTKLAKLPLDGDGKPIVGAKPRSLAIGDTLELNDKRAVVVGICSVSRTFQSQPVIYTTYTRALQYAPRERRLLSFVMAKAKPGRAVNSVCDEVRAQTGLEALSSDDFSWKTVVYFMKYTGIPINFGIAVVLSFAVGTGISGLMFYQFTLENLKHLGALKAMGATNQQILRMIMLQAAVVGAIGYGLGVGLASIFDAVSKHSELAFWLLWQTLVISGVAVVFIAILASLVSVWKVMRLEPAIVFKS